MGILGILQDGCRVSRMDRNSPPMKTASVSTTHTLCPRRPTPLCVNQAVRPPFHTHPPSHILLQAYSVCEPGGAPADAVSTLGQIVKSRGLERLVPQRTLEQGDVRQALRVGGGLAGSLGYGGRAAGRPSGWEGGRAAGPSSGG